MSIQIRPAGLSDQREVCALLHRDMDPSVPEARFANLFHYPWLNAKPDHGFVLLDGERLAGYISTIYSDREINGRMERFCNLSSWYVEPACRNHSLKLLSACHRDRELTFTNITARPQVQKISAALRYRQLGRYKLFTPPLAQLPGLGRAKAADLIADPARIRERLPEHQRRLLDDHLATPCRHLLIEEGSRLCYVVSNRRVKQRVPFTELLYVSDPGLLTRHWELAKLRLLWRDRTLLLAVDEHILRGVPPPALLLRYERVTLYKSPRVEPGQIDNLYTELALL